MTLYQKIINSDRPYIKLPIDFPKEEFLSVSKSIDANGLFHPHRDNQSHVGWESITLHGLATHKTCIPEMYGVSKEEAMKTYHWTFHNNTFKNYFINEFPVEQYARVRIMKLLPHGKIELHQDLDSAGFDSINMALNNPKGCQFFVDGNEIPIDEHDVFMPNIGLPHSVVNNSDETRYHIIVHWFKPKIELIKLVIENA